MEYDLFMDGFGPPPIFMVFFGLIVAVIVGSILVSVIKGITRWTKNNNSPILTVSAEIVNMRHETHHRSSSDSSTTSHTDYYITFEVESGDRIEFEIDGKEYGQLAQNDIGRLTFQGTRYKGFERY